MATPTIASVSKLASASQSLNNASNELSNQLSALEKAINGYGIGLAVWVDLPICYEDDSNAEIQQLGYGKHEGKWCLLWSTHHPENPEGTWRQKPLLESPREIRRLAIKAVPELVDKLSEVAETYAKKTAELAVATRVMVSSLNKP